LSGRHYIGEPILRLEDQRFLTGQGCYTDDISRPEQTWSAVARSPHAHARIKHIDKSIAENMPGVLAVLTHQDIVESTHPIPTVIGFDPAILAGRDGQVPADPPQWGLAVDKVRLVGDGVAFVVAETLAQAQAAAEQVHVDYELLDNVISFEDALDPSSPLLWEQHGSNTSFIWDQGDTDEVEAVFNDAAHTASLTLENPRQLVAFMEPRAILAEYHDDNGTFTVHAGAQSAHSIQNVLSMTLGVPVSDIHVIVPDTGGGFGARNIVYPEFILACFAARAIGRPVHWTAERSEAFLTDTQARDQRVQVDLAMGPAGEFRAIRARIAWRHGAYVPSRSLWVHISFMPGLLCGPYRFETCYLELKGLFTNTGPVHAFRGVGRAEMSYMLERLVDKAAVVSGIDRIELRQRNLIAPEQMPYKTPAGALYGRCEFQRNLDLAQQAIDWQGFEARKAQAARDGRLRGIGVSVYVESTGGAPSEFSEVRVDPEGWVEARMGTQSFGMGHETVFAQVLAERLDVDLEHVRVINGDTALVKQGFGSHGSRSMRIGGGALVLGSDRLMEKATTLAAEHLEVAQADLEYRDGEFVIPGTDRAVSLFELARACKASSDSKLAAEAVFETHNHAFANGAHITEVEIDVETGQLELISHVLVIDVGNVVNPLITRGQLHGGIAQGIGQAVFENVVYEPETGQLQSGSFMDYCLPRADDMPAMTTSFNEVPCEDNPLGAKGAGEGPTTGSPPAVINAILDALSTCGVTELDMPATPFRIWQALQGADGDRTP